MNARIIYILTVTFISFNYSIISAQNYQQEALDILESSRNKLDNVDLYTNNEAFWIQKEIKSRINFDQINLSLSNLESDYEMANNDSQFQQIINQTTDIRIPDSIYSKTNGSAPLDIGVNDIDTSYLESLSGKQVNDREELKSNIINWMNENIEGEIRFEEIVAQYGNISENILTKFYIEINPKKTLKDSYLMLDISSDKIIFMKNYGQKEVNSGSYLILGQEKEVEFIVLDSLVPAELKAYISPDISYFNLDQEILDCDFDNICEEENGEDKNICPNDCKSHSLAITLISIVILAGIIAFVAMQFWYKKNYEKSLFKRKVDLINLVNFIKQAKENGLKEEEMKEKLKKAGWSKEQVNYAIKRLRFAQ